MHRKGQAVPVAEEVGAVPAGVEADRGVGGRGLLGGRPLRHPAVQQPDVLPRRWIKIGKMYFGGWTGPRSDSRRTHQHQSARVWAEVGGWRWAVIATQKHVVRKRRARQSRESDQLWHHGNTCGNNGGKPPVMWHARSGNPERGLRMGGGRAAVARATQRPGVDTTRAKVLKDFTLTPAYSRIQASLCPCPYP